MLVKFSLCNAEIVLGAPKVLRNEGGLPYEILLVLIDPWIQLKSTYMICSSTVTLYSKTLTCGGYLILAILAVKPKNVKT